MLDHLYRAKNAKHFLKEQQAATPTALQLVPQDFVKNKLPELERGRGLIICIADSGTPEHSAIAHNVLYSTNVGPSEGPCDYLGHSHVVAGIVGGLSDAFTGFAPEAQMNFVKVSDDRGATTPESVAAAILWGVLSNANVVIISPVVTEHSDLIDMAVHKALAGQVLIVMDGTSENSAIPAGVISTAGVLVPKGLTACPYKDDTFASVDLADFTPAIVGGITALLVERVKRADKKGRASTMARQIMTLLNGA